MSIIEELQAAGEVLSPRVRAVLEGMEALQALVVSLEARIRELEERLGQNSTNSSLPPSSDPPGVVRPAKKPTGKKRGGQKGHRGHHRARVAPERVDAVLVHRPASCLHCGHGLSGAEIVKEPWVHQVVEMPPVRAQVTEHRMECLRCPGCGKATRARLPEEVGHKHFGARLVALAVELNGRYRMSRREVRDLLSRLLDVPPPSLGSTEAFVQEASAALAPAYAEVQQEVRQSKQANVDETPWKLAGKKHWLWGAVSADATLFHLGKGRGAEELRRFLGTYTGIVSSDRWCAYQIYTRRQLCWAHLERNFRKLELRGGEAARLARRGERICERLFQLWWALRDGRLARDALDQKIQPLRRGLKRLMLQGARSTERHVSGLCRNLLRLWPALWTFVREPVEPTNNAAERALRPAVLWRKGSFGNQSESGLRYVERILTLNATCAQRKINPIDFLSRTLAALRLGATGPTLRSTY